MICITLGGCVISSVLDGSENASTKRCGQGTEAVKGAPLDSSSWVSRRHESGLELRTLDGVMAPGVPRIDLTRGVVVEASLMLRNMPSGLAGVMINHRCTPYTGGGTPPTGVSRRRSWSHDPATAGASLGARVGDPIHQRWCTPEEAGTATLVGVNSAGVVSFQTWSSAPPPAPGRFVRCKDCKGSRGAPGHGIPPTGTFVYWMTGPGLPNDIADQPKQTLYEIGSCDMCGRNLCSFCTGNNSNSSSCKDREVSPAYPQVLVPNGGEYHRFHLSAPVFNQTLVEPSSGAGTSGQWKTLTAAGFDCCMLPGHPSAPCKQWKTVEVIDRQFPFSQAFWGKPAQLQVFVRHTLIEVYLADL